MVISVRKAGVGDAEILSALTTEVWLDTYLLDGILPAYAKYVAASFSVPAVLELLSSGRTQVLFCCEGEYVLGCVFITQPETPLDPDYGTVELERFYIRRHHQRRGLGSLLLAEALHLASNAGHRSVYLRVYDQNQNALAFYEAVGFCRVGEWVFRVDGIEAMNYVLAKSITG